MEQGWLSLEVCERITLQCLYSVPSMPATFILYVKTVFLKPRILHWHGELDLNLGLCLVAEINGNALTTLSGFINFH